MKFIKLVAEVPKLAEYDEAKQIADHVHTWTWCVFEFHPGMSAIVLRDILVRDYKLEVEIREPYLYVRKPKP